MQQQKQEAQCPMCGSPLAKSPAGQQVLARTQQAMSQKARGGQQRPQPTMQRPGMGPMGR